MSLGLSLLFYILGGVKIEWFQYIHFGLSMLVLLFFGGDDELYLLNEWTTVIFGFFILLGIICIILLLGREVSKSIGEKIN